MTELGIGLVGSGFMGRAHAMAIATAAQAFGLNPRPRLEMLADVDPQAAATAARDLGFARSTGDWRQLVAEPCVDVVHITTPNRLHDEIARAAIAAGKAVHCEKPLANDGAAAHGLADVAEAAGVTTVVGFNYLRNPIQALARDIILNGEIGDIIGFRGVHAEGFMCDPAVPFSWRHEPHGGGAAMDLGSHIVSLARFLVGEIGEVMGLPHTVHKTRRDEGGVARAVGIDDQTHGLLAFDGGATGTISASWVAAGRTMQLAYEITGTLGSVAFTQERFNELQLYRAGPDRRTNGFRTIVSGPEHEGYSGFLPAAGHQIGFNDVKAIEMARFFECVGAGRPAFPDFRWAAGVQDVIDALAQSGGQRAWVRVGAGRR